MSSFHWETSLLYRYEVYVFCIPVGGASVYLILNVVLCAVIGQICCIFGTATLRTCQEESCRDSPAPSSVSRKQTCSSLCLCFFYLCHCGGRLWRLMFFSWSSFMFDEPSSYLDVKQRLRAAITIRSLISPDRSDTQTHNQNMLSVLLADTL